jgi:hypothetical protein
MNKEMAGKMTSDVRGRDEVEAAVAKDAKATSNGIPVNNVVLND